MKRKSIILSIEKMVATMAKKAAIVEANTACPYFGYQEKEKKSIKRLRKF